MDKVPTLTEIHDLMVRVGVAGKALYSLTSTLHSRGHNLSYLEGITPNPDDFTDEDKAYLKEALEREDITRNANKTILAQYAERYPFLYQTALDAFRGLQ